MKPIVRELLAAARDVMGYDDNYPDWAPSAVTQRADGEVELTYSGGDIKDDRLDEMLNNLAPDWEELFLQIEWRGSAEKSVETRLQWWVMVDRWEITNAWLTIGGKKVDIPDDILRAMKRNSQIEEDLSEKASEEQ